jgi:small subunit ribosomal protein S1
LTSGNNFQPESMEELLDAVGLQPEVRRGRTVQGIIMHIDRSEGLLVNVGGKSEGLVPLREMRSISNTEFDDLEVGGEVYAYVIRQETEDGTALLSLDRALHEKGWTSLEKALAAEETLEGELVGSNRGGLLINIEGVQAFIPLSHVNIVTKNSIGDPATWNEVPVMLLKVKVLELDRRRQRAIVSERLGTLNAGNEKNFSSISDISEGQTIKGHVSGISQFGAFVDLGGSDGLIHISEMSWSQIKSPEEVVSVGQAVDVYVLNIDRDKNRISLSLKRLQPEPWKTLTERIDIGQIIVGKVTRITPFGAFASVEGGVEGLIHISELSTKHVEHPSQVIKEGESLNLKVLSIDIEQKRLALSRKQVLEELAEEDEV